MAKDVIDFGVCKSCVVSWAPGVHCPGTKYRIIICVRSYGQGRHWFWSLRKLHSETAGLWRPHCPWYKI
jgi:hypothetical protein